MKWIDEFLEVNRQLVELYAIKKALLIQAAADHEIDLIKENTDGTWSRVTIHDNVARIEDGYYEFVKISRYTAKVDVLKNKPKEVGS